MVGSKTKNLSSALTIKYISKLHVANRTINLTYHFCKLHNHKPEMMRTMNMILRIITILILNLPKYRDKWL